MYTFEKSLLLAVSFCSHTRTHSSTQLVRYDHRLSTCNKKLILYAFQAKSYRVLTERLTHYDQYGSYSNFEHLRLIPK